MSDKVLMKETRHWLRLQSWLVAVTTSVTL